MTCKNCNKELENGAKFCPDCGAKLTVKYTKVFENSGLGSKGFMEEINAWFAANPNVANVKCKFTTTVGFGLLVNHYKFKKLVIEYELFSGNNTMQYTVTKKRKVFDATKSIAAICPDTLWYIIILFSIYECSIQQVQIKIVAVNGCKQFFGFGF